MSSQPASVFSSSGSDSVELGSNCSNGWSSRTTEGSLDEDKIASVPDSDVQSSVDSSGFGYGDFFASAVAKLATISWETTVRNTFLELEEGQLSRDVRRVASMPALPLMCWSE